MSHHETATCPKCGADKDGEACARCGVVYEKYDPSSITEGVPQHVLDLWENTRTNWDDKAAHALFVEQALLSDAAGYVAACYRVAGDDPIAREQMERLTGRLMTQLNEGQTERGALSPAMKWTLYTILFLAVAALAFLAFSLLGH